MKKINLWDSKTLLVILAIGQGAALVYASVAFDGHDIASPLFWLAMLRGLTIGIGAAFGTSFAANELPRGNRRKIVKQLGYAALGILIVMSGLFVTIGTNNGSSDGWRIAASIAYALVTDAAVVAVAASSGHLFADSDAQPTPTETAPRHKREKRGEYVCPVCQVDKKTQNALNGHMRAHKVVLYDVTQKG